MKHQDSLSTVLCTIRLCNHGSVILNEAVENAYFRTGTRESFNTNVLAFILSILLKLGLKAIKIYIKPSIQLLLLVILASSDIG